MSSLNKYEAKAFILELVNRSKTRPTRTQIQKELFILTDLCKVPLPFDFLIHEYGPYDFSLDDEIRELVALDYLEDVSTPIQYGSRYEVTKIGQDYLSKFDKVIEKYDEHLGSAISLFSGHNVGVLELASTAIYVINNMEITNREKALKTIKNIKPKYSKKDIEKFYDISLEVVEDFEELFS